MASLPSAPLDAGAAALAAEAHAAVATLPEVDARLVLKRVLRAQIPGRTTVPRQGGTADERVSIAKASIVELLAAVDVECAAAHARAVADEHPHRAVARRFRLAGAEGSAAHAACIHTEEAAVSAGALDFSPTAAWRSDEALRQALGIIVVSPPTPSSDSTSFCAFSATGGVYTLAAAPGFYVLPNSLPINAQEHWVAEILSSFIEPPNRRNIDAEMDPDFSNVAVGGGFYSEAGSSRATTGYGGRTGAPHTSTPASKSEESSPGITEDASVAFNSTSDCDRTHSSRVTHASSPRAHNVSADNNTVLPSIPRPAFEKDIWRRHVSTRDASLLPKLAWATLGHQYDWTCRSYHLPGDVDYAQHCHAYIGEANNRWYAPFPQTVHTFSGSVARMVHVAVAAHATELRNALGVPDFTRLGLPMDKYDAQSGICNFYAATSRQPMGMHVDDMERRTDKPVVSLSLGCTCVFTIGDTSRVMPPTPVLVRSGDVTILSGASRLAFHGVPRVLAGTAPAALFAAEETELCRCAEPCALREWNAAHRAAARDYITRSRININVRQVM